MTHEHRKKSQSKRNGRSKYEKGRRHYNFGEARPQRKRRGDRANLNYSPVFEPTTLADVWPK